MNITERFENGRISTPTENFASSETPFAAHPKFAGVSLKHLVNR